MKSAFLYFTSIMLIIFLGDHKTFAQPENGSWIRGLMHKHPQWFAGILQDPDKYEIQILYTQIDRKKHKPTLFRTYGYGVNAQKYFYPGETVALPAALLALEKLNQHKLDKYTPVFISRTAQDGNNIFGDSTSENGSASIGHYIKKMLLASDHEAFNSICDFIGLDINEILKKKGYTGIHLNHRLSTKFKDEDNQMGDEVFFINQLDTLYRQPNKYSTQSDGVRRDVLNGVGYLQDSSQISAEHQNEFVLKDAHKILKSIFFPESLQQEERFDLTENDYQFLYQYMSQLPVETSFPASYAADMNDGTMKYFLFGGKNTRLPRHIRSFNKVGQSHGYLMDHAYIVDFEKGIEFMLSAVIYCNQDDGAYESIGKPFLENLGKVIFEYELNRKRTSRPDLSKYEVDYDK